MLKNSVLVIVFSLISCKSTNYVEEQPKCPKGYECYGEILQDQSIKILRDNIDKIYIQVNKNESYNLIKYTYKYSGQPNIADDSYSETFYFQVSKGENKISLTDKELLKTKALVQKSCFCPDAGYERIQQGQLEIKKQKNNYYIKFKYQPKRNMNVRTIETTVGL